MRILVAGAMTHLPGHLATGSGRAFAELGHEVEIHDYLGFRNHPVWKLGNRARLRSRALRRILYPSRRHGLLQAVRRFQPDLLFVIGGEVFDAVTIRKVRAMGTKPVLWVADDPYQKDRELNAAPAYDLVYVFDPWYVAALKENGVRRAEYLPMACDPAVHRPVALSDRERRELSGEACFVGTWYPKREEILRAIRGPRIQIWGGGWPLALARPGHPLRSLYRGQASGEQMVKIYCAHRAVLNIQHPQSREAQNMRSFEAPACGALTFTEMTVELPKLYRVDEEIVAYRNVGELCAKLAHLLEKPAQADRIARAGMRRAREEHSYRRRMERVLAEAA